MVEDSFIPVNRHLRVTPVKKQQKTSTGVLLPEGFGKEKGKYQRVEVVSVANDCKEVFRSSVGREIYVDMSMIQEITVLDMEVSLVLENYVIGVLP